jgi:hypothetical protein
MTAGGAFARICFGVRRRLHIQLLAVRGSLLEIGPAGKTKRKEANLERERSAIVGTIEPGVVAHATLQAANPGILR